MSIEKTCCFTGHRPEKIGIPEGTVIALLDKAISEANPVRI